MSVSSEKGRNYEMHIASIMRKKLRVKAYRDKRSGAAWHRKSDITTDLPGVHIECKAHDTVKVKEWFRQADDAASFNEKPIVVFQMDDDDLTIMRFTDVIDLLLEISDLKQEVEDLQAPINTLQTVPPVILNDRISTQQVDGFLKISDMNSLNNTSSLKLKKTYSGLAYIKDNSTNKETHTFSQCRNGHIMALGMKKCNWKGCPYSAGYKAKKEKK